MPAVRRLVAALSLMAFPSLAAPQTVAVLPLRPLGVRPDAALALEGTLRGEVARIPEVKVADEAVVAKALRAEPDCVASVKCAARAALRAGAARFLVGTVSELGELYMLDLKLLDAKTGKELRRAQQPISEKKDLLIAAVRAAAVQLVAPERYSGALFVDAVASGQPLRGADLYLDGKLVGRTPLEKPLGGLVPGQHALRVSQEGAKDVEVFVEVRFERITVAQVDVILGGVARVGWVSEDTPLPLGLAATGVEGETAGPTGPVMLVVAQQQPRSPLLRIGGWSALGIGVVSAAVGLAFHARAYSTAADLNRREQQNQLNVGDIASYADIDREVKTARVLYVLGGIFAAGGAGALLYDRLLDRRPTLQPVVRADGGGVALVGSF